jgi:hypothetical protein
MFNITPHYAILKVFGSNPGQGRAMSISFVVALNVSEQWHNSIAPDAFYYILPRSFQASASFHCCAGTV